MDWILGLFMQLWYFFGAWSILIFILLIIGVVAAVISFFGNLFDD